jgi:hypothetical protein
MFMTTVASIEASNRKAPPNTKNGGKEGNERSNKQQGNAPNTQKSAYWQHCLDWAYAT